MQAAPGTVRSLKIWEKAIQLVESSYRISAVMPIAERFGLIAQIRRAATSVPANIAEGYGRWSSKEFGRFLAIANGSLRELETHLIVASRLGFVSKAAVEPVFARIDELARMLCGLRIRVSATIQSANARSTAGPKSNGFPKTGTRNSSF